MQTLKTIKTPRNVPIKGEGGKTNHWKMQQYLTPNLVVISELFLKKAEYQREQGTPETEANVPSNTIKSDLIVID